MKREKNKKLDQTERKKFTGQAKLAKTEVSLSKEEKQSKDQINFVALIP